MSWDVKALGPCHVQIGTRNTDGAFIPRWTPLVMDGYSSCAVRCWRGFSDPVYFGNSTRFPDVATMDKYFLTLREYAYHPGGYEKFKGSVKISGVIADYQIGQWHKNIGLPKFFVDSWLNKVHNDGTGKVHLFLIDTDDWLTLWHSEQRGIYERWLNDIPKR